MSKRIIDILRTASFCFSMLFALWSCDVHEFPESKERVDIVLKLAYETEFMRWEHSYDGENMNETAVGPKVESVRENGYIRNIIKVYPVTQKQRSMGECIEEYVVTRNIADGYDCEIPITVPVGEYKVCVWSDMVANANVEPHYNADDFAVIHFNGDYRGNNDYRDAFRGTGELSVERDYTFRAPDTLNVAMQRPMAKLEFITTDIVEFVEKEITRITRKNASAGASQPSEVDKTRVNISDYMVRLSYNYMRDNYSFITDKPMYSVAGAHFDSYISALNSREAVLGFDYAFVGTADTKVYVTISVFDAEGEMISSTNLMEVPLMRNRHTVMRGMFLMENAVGGVTIDPDYEGDHNLIFPKPQR